MKVSFNGWKEHVATFETAAALEAGSVVKISGNGAVSACGDGDKFAGAVVSQRGDFAAVQLRGYAELPFTGTAPAVGFQTLCADGSGGVKTGSAGRELLVTYVNAGEKTVGLIL